MARPDLNLLVTLDVLLAEASVARARSGYGSVPSAMSRALARLRAQQATPCWSGQAAALVPTEARMVGSPSGEHERGRGHGHGR
jgi:DNA-binding transcriptional LysR family regulator